ncbi:MAG: peptidylprolyl isomerase [Bacillota bacterium]|nr:peptidylprolyl isomerase [Bacillota bacterium]
MKRRILCMLCIASLCFSAFVNVYAEDSADKQQESANQTSTLTTTDKTVTQDVYNTSSVTDDVYKTPVTDDVYTSDATVSPIDPIVTPTVDDPTPTPTPVKDEIGSVTNISILIDSKPVYIKTFKVNGRVYASLTELCFYFNTDYKVDSAKKLVNILKDKKSVQKSVPQYIKKSSVVELVKLQPGIYNIKVDNIDTYLESFIYLGKSFVPVRYFAELYNRKVDFVTSKNQITIAKIDNPVIGTVNGQPLYKSDFDYFYNGQYEDLAANTPKENLAAEAKKLKQQVFDNIVSLSLVKQNISKEFTTLKDMDYQQINDNIGSIISNNGGIEQIRSILAKSKITYYQFIQDLKINYMNSNYANDLIKNVVATDAELKKYYDDNKASFLEPEKVKAKHILFSTMDQQTQQEYTDEKKEEVKKKAQEVLDSIKAGADFDELMNKYTEDPGTKDMPDNAYTFGKGEMVQEFEDAAFSLKVGEISDLVKSSYGYHIIKVLDKIPAKQLTFDEVKDQIKPQLDEQAKSTYINNLLAKWKASSKIVNSMK